jgi:hypothetical protein
MYQTRRRRYFKEAMKYHIVGSYYQNDREIKGNNANSSSLIFCNR